MPAQIVLDRNCLIEKLQEAGEKLVLIDFYADWCEPCKLISPKLEEYATEYPDIVVLKVDIDENMDIANEYNVILMPTIIFIKNKEMVSVFRGSQYEEVLSMIEVFK